MTTLQASDSAADSTPVPMVAPPAPDSVTTLAADTKEDKVLQLKKHWATGAADTQFPETQLETLCQALQNRGPQNKSRLDYVLRAEGTFADPHARACALSFLLHDYVNRRAGSAIANEKWVLAKRGLLAIRENLPEHLRGLPLFRNLETTSDVRPRKPSNWRDQ